MARGRNHLIIALWIVLSGPSPDSRAQETGLWSLVTPTRPEPPTVKHREAVANALDRFVLARLEKEGLAPSRRADRRTLIRRVTLDLTGLPPTRKEIHAFLNDGSERAFEALVDRLLNSERHGEHMARYWLDVVRYADTHGLHFDNYREMWHYRDWVIRAFNTGMPFSQFVTEQLAGDLLPDRTLDQRIASGFNRLNITTNEGGSIYEEVFVRNVVDRVEAFGTVFLGLTTGCAVCHDHKFDPLTMRDFYQLFAFFNSLDGRAMDGNSKSHPPFVRVPNDEQQRELADFDQRLAMARSQIKSPWPTVDKSQTEWENSLAAASPPDNGPEKLKVSDWHSIGPFPIDVVQATLKDGRVDVEAKGLRPGQQTKYRDKVYGWTPRPEWRDVETHQVPYDDLEFSVIVLYRTIESVEEQDVTFLVGADDAFAVYLDGKEIGIREAGGPLVPYQDGVTAKLKPGTNHLYLRVANYRADSSFSFAIRSPSMPLPSAATEILKIDRAERTDDQEQTLRSFYRETICVDKDLLNKREELKKLVEERQKAEESVSVSLVFEAMKKPRPAYILTRGNYNQKGDQVERNTPTFLPPMPANAPRDRLGLAAWLADPAHPLFARVAVNRFWQQIFGRGLVETSGDFGAQGTPPSHPRLLDWLAVDFRESGWDVKRLVKELVMSATYRQSSRVTPELLTRDPDNRWLARGVRFRLDAESLRDQALAASGLLVNKIGGPGIRPPQPAGLWKAVAFTGSDTALFKANEGDDVYRRSVYIFWKRTATSPTMSTFDAPSRESCTARRERTNTPLQALLLMNEVQYVEAARQLARTTLDRGGNTPEQKIDFAFETVTARLPTASERLEILGLLRDLLKAYRDDLKAASALAGTENEPVQIAAWTAVTNVLLNLDEVVTKG